MKESNLLSAVFVMTSLQITTISIDSGSLDSGSVYIKFANQQNLKKHVGTVHEGMKPFKCSVCDVKFAKNYNP